MLSQQTMEGIRITGSIDLISSIKLSSLLFFWLVFFYTVNSFVELTTILLTVPGVACVLSEKFCQDPLESFFGKQRARGGRSDNPDAKQFCDSTVSLRVQSSFQLEPVRGNCGKRKVSAILSADQPLQKRRRNKKNRV